ncbi:MAG: PorV/PorQ family protein [Bacteroidota bacterium]
MMKRIKHIVIASLCVAVFSLSQETDNSKRGTTAASFLSIGQGARAVGMGSAFVAVADDRSSLYWNPAGIADLYNNGVLVDRTQWIADVDYTFIAASFSMQDYGAIGFHLSTSKMGEMDVTTVEYPDGTGEMFDALDVAFGVTYAVKLTDAFTIGVTPKVVYQRIWRMSATAMAVDIGIKYATPFKGITLGMSVTNFGQKMQLAGNNGVVLYDPAPKEKGNNDRIPANLLMEEWPLPLNFRVGLAYDLLSTEDHTVVLAVDALHPNDNNESVNAGAEYTFQKFLSVRGGYKTLFLDTSEESFALGFGIQKELLNNVSLRVDYAYQNFQRLNYVQKFQIEIVF